MALSFKEQQCRGGKLIDKVALAVTANPDLGEGEVVERNGVEMDTRRPTQIQLCLWFVDWIKQKQFKLADDVQKRTKLGRVVIKLAEKNFGLKQIGKSSYSRSKAQLTVQLIDAFSLLDKVLLHEMTHGRGAWEERAGSNVVQEGLIDVSSTSRVLSWLGWGAYGWKGAMQIARQGDELGGDDAPDNNADTIALLGSGKSATPHIHVLETDGSVVSKLMSVSAREGRRKVDSKGRIIPRVQ
jgi:hypothetical protein